MLTVTINSVGQFSVEPKEVVAQACWRIASAIWPSPCMRLWQRAATSSGDSVELFNRSMTGIILGQGLKIPVPAIRTWRRLSLELGTEWDKTLQGRAKGNLSACHLLLS